jgi:hypothetical protein
MYEYMSKETLISGRDLEKRTREETSSREKEDS